jgi:3-oxoacyl-[acyl-carrier-protein] synthase I
MLLAIEALGTFTSVGTDVQMTMASLLSQFQSFDDLDVRGSDGEALSGALTPLAAGLAGVDRLGALGLLALRECVGESTQRQSVPLLVSAPEGVDLGGTPADLLDRILADASLPIDRQQSRVLGGGGTGVVDALLAARVLLEQGQAPACYLLAVDSLATGDRPRRLLAEGKLLDGNNSNGFIPGEAAVALRLAKPGGARARGLIAGVGAAVDGHAAGVTVSTGEGLARAAEQALSEAKVSAAQIKALAHEVSGAHGDFEELLMARSRPPLIATADAEVFSAALSVGEVGTAAGPLNLAMLAFFMEQLVIEGPSLCLFRSPGEARGAAVLVPATS